MIPDLREPVDTQSVSLRIMAAREALRAFLTGHRLHAEVGSGLGCESFSDFAGYWSAASQDFEADILNHLPTFKGGGGGARIQLSRLQIAWGQAGGEMAKAQVPGPTDLESPPRTEESQAQQQGWTNASGLQFHPDEDPAQHLKNRVFREFTRRRRTVDELAKMRAASNTPAVSPETRKQVGDVAIVLTGSGSAQLPPLPLTSVMEVTRAHQIMINLWSVWHVESSQQTGTWFISPGRALRCQSSVSLIL